MSEYFPASSESIRQASPYLSEFQRLRQAVRQLGGLTDFMDFWQDRMTGVAIRPGNQDVALKLRDFGHAAHIVTNRTHGYQWELIQPEVEATYSGLLVGFVLLHEPRLTSGMDREFFDRLTAAAFLSGP